MLHGNARTCLYSRRLIVERVCVQGWTLAQAAEAAGVSVRTVSKWLHRFRLEGDGGLADFFNGAGLAVPEHLVQIGRLDHTVVRRDTEQRQEPDPHRHGQVDGMDLEQVPHMHAEYGEV